MKNSTEIVELLDTIHGLLGIDQAVNIEVSFTDRISDEIKKQGEEGISIAENCNRELDNLNGTIFYNGARDVWYVYISTVSEQFKNQMWDITLIHEISHIYDYINFSKFTGTNLFFENINHKYHNAFFIWSEYKAQYIGFLCKIWAVYGEEIYKDSSLEEMIEAVNNIVIKREDMQSLNYIYDLESLNYIMCQYDAIQEISQGRCKPVMCLFEEPNRYRESILFLDLHDIIKQRNFEIFIEDIEKIERLVKILIQ